MSIELLFAVTLVALALILFGAVFLFRRSARSVSSEAFKDCYELCSRDSRQDSTACNTVCAVRTSI